MTDFWTDKKRGFVGVPGNLSPNTQSLSFQRFMRQELGGLDQTQVKRFTPEGEMTIKAFGNYEKVITEPVITPAQITISGTERLVLLNASYYGEGWVWRSYMKLIQIEDSHYVVTQEIYDGLQWNAILNSISWPFGISWNYGKSRFLLWSYYDSNDEYYLDEITLEAGRVRIAQYYEKDGDWYWPRFFNSYSYGAEGVTNRMWIGTESRALDNNNGGFRSVLNLKNNYGIKSYGTGDDRGIEDPEVYTEFTQADDCESYPGYYILFKTHTGASILSPNAGEAYFNQYQFACDFYGKISYMFRQSEDSCYELRVCNKKWRNHVTKDGSKAFVPAAYLDDYTTIWEGGSMSTTTTPVMWNYYGGVVIVGSYEAYRSIEVTFDAAQMDVPEVGYLTVHYLGYRRFYDPLRADETIYGDVVIQYYGSDYFEIKTYTLNPADNIGGFWAADPAGNLHYINMEGYSNCWFALLGWKGNDYSGSTAWEPVTGLACVNRHYCIIGGLPIKVGAWWFYYPALKVLNSSGTEKYRIRLIDQNSTDEVLVNNSLEQNALFISKASVINDAGL